VTRTHAHLVISLACIAAGRGIVSELRGKELVMRLMMHPDPDVQSQALKCVQKVLLSKDKSDFLTVGL
jgi:V-type H+-transporting ATPase subunit H